MKYKEFLLSDEKEITETDFKERKKLVDEFLKMPEDFFSKLRHFQPQIGCLNACKICSKFAGTTTEYWTESRQRNVVAALKYSTPKVDLPLIVWDRSEHRSGVIFSYLDNDVGNYFYLDKFVELVHRELGVVTRISTVGYSRFNEKLNEVHKKINTPDLLRGLGGVRLSFTPYEIGWECPNGKQEYSKTDYINDMANFLSIYKPYYAMAGSGSRHMCVEIRYKPLVNISEVYTTNVLDHMVICTKNYLYISQDKNVQMKEAKILDPYDHNIVLTQQPTVFYQMDLYQEVENFEKAQKLSHKFIISGLEGFSTAEVYMMSNAEGCYYAINPSMTEKGNFGINIYPKTSKRVNSGYIITERFLVNAMIAYKTEKNLKRLDKFENATWKDVYGVLNICDEMARIYEMANKADKSSYITNEVLPMVNAYISALQEAGYNATDFFDPEFTIDTGIICNLGRAIEQFKGITLKLNEPLTPVHERNYGNYNSKMSKEGTAWRLSCDYNNKIVIERLDLFNTTGEQGQVSFKKQIQLEPNNELLDQTSLTNNYLIPGQRRL